MIRLLFIFGSRIVCFPFWISWIMERMFLFAGLFVLLFLFEFAFVLFVLFRFDAFLWGFYLAMIGLENRMFGFLLFLKMSPWILIRRLRFLLVFVGFLLFLLLMIVGIYSRYRFYLCRRRLLFKYEFYHFLGVVLVV